MDSAKKQNGVPTENVKLFLDLDDVIGLSRTDLVIADKFKMVSVPRPLLYGFLVRSLLHHYHSDV